MARNGCGLGGMAIVASSSDRVYTLTWSCYSERHLMVDSAVVGDLTAEIKSPRGRGFVCVLIHTVGRQLSCFREVTSIVRAFVRHQPHVVLVDPLKHDVSTRCHSLCPL